MVNEFNGGRFGAGEGLFTGIVSAKLVTSDHKNISLISIVLKRSLYIAYLPIELGAIKTCLEIGNHPLSKKGQTTIKNKIH